MNWPGEDIVPTPRPPERGHASPDPAQSESADPPRVPHPRTRTLRAVEVLLPALNEEQAVGSVIDSIPTEDLRRMGYTVRVWVVDGRSTDSTLKIARDKGANVFLQTGEGKGTGVRQAIDHLLQGVPGPDMETRMFVMLDADGSYPADCIPAFVGALESGLDAVLGSRFLGRVEQGAITGLNRLGNRCLSGLASVLFGARVTDVCTGMWAFREDAIRKFVLAANGFDLEADLFGSCCELGVRIGELPIDYRRRIGQAKLVPLRTGALIAWRLLMRRLKRPLASIGMSGNPDTRNRRTNITSGPATENEGTVSGDDRLARERLVFPATEEWA